jgi:hypothetical protein
MEADAEANAKAASKRPSRSKKLLVDHQTRQRRRHKRSM